MGNKGKRKEIYREILKNEKNGEIIAKKGCKKIKKYRKNPKNLLPKFGKGNIIQKCKTITNLM